MAYFRCGGGSSGGAKVTLDGEPNTDSWAITYEGSTYSYPHVKIPAMNNVDFSRCPSVAFNDSIYVFKDKTIYSWYEGAEYWTVLGNMPYRCLQAVVYNGMIYLFLYVKNKVYKVYIYNGLHLDAGGIVTEIMDWPSDVYNDICVVKDKIYGYSNKYENGIVLDVYNGSTLTKKNVTYASNNEHIYVSLFNYKNELHFMDKISAGSEGILSSHKHCKYNEDTNTFTVIGVVPYITSDSNSQSPSTSYHSCQLGERFYIISDNPSAPLGICVYDWYFDGSVWNKINTKASYNTTAVTYKNSIYSLCGYRSTDNYRYIDIIPKYSVTKVE